MMITGFNEAIIGVAKRCAQPDLIAYDVEKILNILIKRDGMSHEEAVEYFEFNIAGFLGRRHNPLLHRQEN